MLKISLEKSDGLTLLPSITYYKLPFLMQRNAYGHCLAVRMFRKTLYVWFAKTNKKKH